MPRSNVPPSPRAPTRALQRFFNSSTCRLSASHPAWHSQSNRQHQQRPCHRALTRLPDRSGAPLQAHSECPSSRRTRGCRPALSGRSLQTIEKLEASVFRSRCPAVMLFCPLPRSSRSLDVTLRLVDNVPSVTAQRYMTKS